MMKVYNIEEYGTNFSPEIYDPKRLYQDANCFYENLGELINKFHGNFK